jgi:nucleoside-diphosphate-sugar epimerase
MLGREGLIRFGASETADEDLPALVADPSRARTVLGWQPDLDLEGRLGDAVQWWLTRIEQPAASELTA